VAQAYLEAWRAGDYDTMYSLLTPDSQLRINREQLQGFYSHALNQATVDQIDIQLQSLLHNGPEASVLFHTTWQTRLFGPIDSDHQMRLQFLDNRWGVAWQPTLVLPQLGEGLTLTFLDEKPARGNIYDKNFHALATQGQMITVGVIPQFLDDPDQVVEVVSRVTDVEPEKIQAAIAAARPDWFVPIGDITFDESLEYDNLLRQFPGVDRRAHAVRTYTDGETAAHLVGYMGAIPAERKDEYLSKGYQPDDLIGLAGVEGWGELYLAGQRGGRLVTISPSQNVMAEVASVPTEPGSSVHLTIDTGFQATVERLLGERLGAIVVMDPQSGTVHALASYPRFKPAVLTGGFDIDAWTELYTDEKRPLVNRPAQGVYPPGSIFKIVSISAALESLGMKPDRQFTCTGKWAGLGKEFEKACWLERGHGTISLVDGLTQSCDVVFYEVGLALHRQNPQLLPEWARAFGLGALTGIQGVSESAGVVVDDAWKRANLSEPLFPGDTVNSAIGQGFMLSTPLQVARMLAAIGNGGRLVKPRLVDRTVNLDGTEQVIVPEGTGALPLSPESLALIQDSLEAVVSGARGTARAAFEGMPYTVAGKTGTSESGQEEPHAWFAGYAPADKPRVVIAVILEHAGEGSKEAAPLFRQVAEAFFAWEAEQS
jgi:penicillin-binding protein 2